MDYKMGMKKKNKRGGMMGGGRPMYSHGGPHNEKDMKRVRKAFGGAMKVAKPV
tara:strand:+ start:674 stop:832 length:159 start_codon:yes stop_codon:yes gene_type:complete